MAKNYDSIKNLKNYEKNHSFLAEPLLVPGVNKTDCNRLTMFTAQLSQTVVKNQGEAPLVFTNFENMIGDWTIDGFKRNKGNTLVLGKIYRNKLNYTMIIKNLDTGMISHIDRKEACWLTEHYGFKYNNTVIDEKEVGDTLKDSEMLYRSNTYDDNGNLMYGRNLKSCYMTFKNLTLEDPIVISKTASEKMSYSSVNKVKINMNPNDILLNLYGDEEDYKAFPNVGEDVREDGVLASRRRIEYNKILANLKDKKLMEYNDDDMSFFCKGKIVDIEVYNNQDIDELAHQEYNSQLYDLQMQDRTYRTKLVTLIEKHMKPDGSNLEPELVLLYNKCKLLLENLDPNKKDKNVWLDEGSEFKGTVLVFTILEHHNLTVGSKLSGRYGK